MKPAQPTITPLYVEPATLKGLRNMKPNTYPAEPLNPEEMVSKAVVVEIPRKDFEGDWLIDLENDIQFLEHHFQCGVGDMLWVRESHRLHVKEKQVFVEYMDGERRLTSLLPGEVNFTDGRKIPPVAMKKLACRFILRVREIGVKWLDPDKRSRLVWIVGIERMADPEYVIELEKRGALT